MRATIDTNYNELASLVSKMELEQIDTAGLQQVRYSRDFLL